MAKRLSTTEQLNCLIIALETEKDALGKEAQSCQADLEKFQEGTPLYALHYGLYNAKQDAANRLERILTAAKKQREM